MILQQRVGPIFIYPKEFCGVHLGWCFYHVWMFVTPFFESARTWSINLCGQWLGIWVCQRTANIHRLKKQQILIWPGKFYYVEIARISMEGLSALVLWKQKWRLKNNFEMPIGWIEVEEACPQIVKQAHFFHHLKFTFPKKFTWMSKLLRSLALLFVFLS